MKYLIQLLLLLSFLSFNNVTAQNSRKGKIGIGYSGMFTSNTNDINATFWLKDKFFIEPVLGFHNVSIDGKAGTNYKLGMGFLFCLDDIIVTPYLGGRVGGIFATGSETRYSDFVLSFVFGGEYFVSDWFSVGTEMRINYISTDKEFSPGYSIPNAKILETQQVMNLKVYLK